MNTAIHNVKTITATVIRVAMIFLFLVIASDSLTRMYYSYMPITTWINFVSVEVVQEGDGPVVKIERYPEGEQFATFQRVLSIYLPVRERACGSSIQGVVNETESGYIQVPLSYALSAGCAERLEGRNIEARLQVSYVFEFPFGIRRIATRYSNPFRMTQLNGQFRVDAVLAAK